MTKRIDPGEKLSRIVAFCAILISLASFYATYLQATAAEKQVQAMTLPLMSFGHGNYDEDSQLRVLQLSLKNSGSGPAIVRSTKLIYEGATYAEPFAFLRACCGPQLDAYQESLERAGTGARSIEEGGYLTSPFSDVVIPAQSELEFFQLYDHELSHALWLRLNSERWKLEVETCFCNLLEDCYVSRGRGLARSVRECQP